MLTQGMVIQGGEAVGTELALIGLNIARLIRDLYRRRRGRRASFGSMDPDGPVDLIGQQIYGAMAVRAAEVAPQAGLRGGSQHLRSSSCAASAPGQPPA